MNFPHPQFYCHLATERITNKILNIILSRRSKHKKHTGIVRDIISFFFFFPLLQHLSVADAQKIASHSAFILQCKDLEDSFSDECLLTFFKSVMVQVDMKVDLLKAELLLSIIALVISFTS